MPRASTRKGGRSRPTPPPVKAAGKKAARERPAKTPPSKPNGSTRGVATKPPARASRPAERRASEKTVQAGRTMPAAETSAGGSRGKYVYCIIESGDPLRFGPIGIGADPSDVYTVH